MKGLLVSILVNKSYGSASNGGISSKHSQVILTGKGLPEIFEPSEDTPEVRLCERLIGGKTYLSAYPIEPVSSDRTGYMFGGCFIYTSDSRFPNAYPIPLHDRTE